MNAQRPTPAQLRAIEAVANGKVAKMVGLTDCWVRPGGVRPSALARAEEVGWIEVKLTAKVGMSRIERYQVTDAGRAALDAARGTRA